MHFTERTDQPRPTVFPKMLGKEKGHWIKCHCDKSSFILMVVCSFVFLCFFLSFFLSFSFLFFFVLFCFVTVFCQPY